MDVRTYLDSTYLKTNQQANLSEAENVLVAKSFIEEAIREHFKLIMIRPDRVALAKKMIQEAHSNLLIGTVIDFPNGQSDLATKLAEAEQAIANGADDLDFVCNYEAFKKSEIALVKEEQYASVFVKSSTGFYVTPNNEPNGATVDTIKIMLENASPLPVKAAGGVRSYADAVEMIQLGVQRIGTSGAKAIIDGITTQNEY